MQTGVYSAEFGHEASQVNVVSKSGTNTYHGSMYDFIRNNLADANPYYFSYNGATPKVFPLQVERLRIRTRWGDQNSTALQRQRQVLLHGR